MYRKLTLLTTALGITFLFHNCTKEETLPTASILDFFPLEIGRSITYRMDSTVFVNFNSREEVHSYQVKDVVEDLITDNLNRPTYRIRRYIRDTAATQPWADDATFLVTPTRNTLELNDNNLRFIK